MLTMIVDRREALIEALVKAPFKTVYHDDGAADATVTAVATPDASAPGITSGPTCCHGLTGW